MENVNNVSDGKLAIDYEDAKKHWESIPATVDGMLGGFAKISPTDINGSREFMRPYITMGGGETETNRALDCGAGIGRITKRLLLPIFKEVDMVELSQKFLDQAPGFIGEESSRVKNRFCSGLQDFIPAEGHYNVIWCQWVLGQLTDTDLITFFQRCKAGLSQNGVLFIKENVTDEEREFDKEDSSYTRTLLEMKSLMERSGLTIISNKRQKGFPKSIYNVYMFALR